MKLTFLGTAAFEGIPALFCPCPVCASARKVGGREVRTRSGAIIDGRLKLDFCPDTYLHILREGLDFSALEHLLITHSHSDHYALWDLMARLPSFANLPADAPPLTVYGNERVGDMMMDRLREAGEENTRRLSFQRMIPYAPEAVGAYRVTALRARHKPDEEALFYLIEKDGKQIVYAHDTSVFPDDAFEYLAGRGVDLYSLDSTSGMLDGGSGHMGEAQLLTVRDRLLKEGGADAHTRFVLNHFSHNGLLTHGQLLERMAPKGFEVAYDGLSVEV